MYHPFMDMLKNSIYSTSKNEKFLQFDVMDDELNDCFEILVITTDMSLDHWMFIDLWEERLTLEFSMPCFSLRNITHYCVFYWPSALKKPRTPKKEAIFRVCLGFLIKNKTNTA